MDDRTDQAFQPGVPRHDRGRLEKTARRQLPASRHELVEYCTGRLDDTRHRPLHAYVRAFLDPQPGTRSSLCGQEPDDPYVGLGEQVARRPAEEQIARVVQLTASRDETPRPEDALPAACRSDGAEVVADQLVVEIGRRHVGREPVVLRLTLVELKLLASLIVELPALVADAEMAVTVAQFVHALAGLHPDHQEFVGLTVVVDACHGLEGGPYRWNGEVDRRLPEVVDPAPVCGDSLDPSVTQPDDYRAPSALANAFSGGPRSVGAILALLRSNH